MAVDNRYFHFRDRFDFSSNRFNIGNPVFQNKVQADNFFLKKLYQLSEAEYEDYYNFHLSYFLESYPNQDEVFFNHVHDIVHNRIKFFKRQNPFSDKYARSLDPTIKLEAFASFLKSIERWKNCEPLGTVIVEKDDVINRLKQRIEELETKLKQASRFDASEKIVISKSALSAFMNLVHQLQDLTLPNGNKLTRSQTQSPWYKMIAKYFIHGDKEISIDTVRNYFPAQKSEKPAKFIEIAEKDKLFKIMTREQK